MSNPTPLVQVYVADTSGVRRGLDQARGATRRYSRDSRNEASSVGRSFMTLGNVAKGAIATVAVMAFVKLKKAIGEAFGEAMRFSSGMAEVSTLVDTSTVNMKALRAGLVDIASTIPNMELDTLAKGLYQTISAGVDAGQALDVLRVAAQAAVGGVTDVATAVDGITNVINGFGLQASDATRVADAMFIAVKKGKTTFGELSANIGQVAAVAKTFNVSLEEVLAAVAAITATGLTTSEAITQVAAVFTAAAKKGKDFAKIGVDIRESLGEKGLQRTLIDVAEGAENAGVELVDLFGRVEGAKATISLTTVAADNFTATMGEMETKAGSTALAFQKMYDEGQQLWALVKQKLRVEFMDAASTWLPTFNAALGIAIRLLGQTPREAAQAFLVVQQAMARTKEHEAMIARYVELSDKVQMTAEEAVEWKTILQTLSAEFPGYVTSLNEAGEATSLYAEGIAAAIEKQKEMREQQIAARREDLVGPYIDAARRLREARSEQVQALTRRTAIEGQDPERIRFLAGIRKTPQWAKEVVPSDVVKRVEQWMKANEDFEESVLSTNRILGEHRETVAAILQAYSDGESLDSGGLSAALEEAGMSFKEADAAANELLRLFESVKRNAPTVEEPIIQPSGGGGPAPSRRRQVNVGLADWRRMYQPETELGIVAAEAFAAADAGQRAIEELETHFDRFKVVIDGIKSEVATGETSASYGLLRMANEAGKADMALTDLFIKLRDSGSLTKDELEAFTALYVEMSRDIKAVADEGKEVIGETIKETEKARPAFEKLSKTLTSLVRLGRGILSLADSMGILSDDTRKVVESALAAVDAYEALKDAQTSSDASGLATAAAGVGVASAVAGVLISLGGALFGGGEDQTEAIKENTRRIEEAIFELTEAVRVGSDISRDDVDMMVQMALQGTVNNPFSPGGNIGDFMGGLTDLFDFMGSLDIPGSEAWQARLNMLGDQIAAGLSLGGIHRVLAERSIDQFMQELLAFMLDLQNGLGTFSNTTIAGILAQAGFMQQFGGADATQTFQDILAGALGLDTGQLAAYLEELSGLSPTENAKQIRDIIATIAGMVTSGQIDFGELTPTELDDLLAALQGTLTDTPGAAQDEYTKSVQIARAITEIQATELVAIAEMQLIRLTQIRDLLGWGGSGSSNSVFNIPVNVSGGLSDQTIEDILFQMEQRLRQEQRANA